jgi:hypothetical protein
LNVFINIVIGISPSHSHCNVFAMHTHLYIFFFTLYNDSLINLLRIKGHFQAFLKVWAGHYELMKAIFIKNS